ncbi:PAS domain S-box protein, partial [Natronoarchaeum mannanilyticum]|uniref:PAS domain S-box protein n=1 Tax=Natronoarchaeum mannanilyticum TaxID=926360 RepID=UPI003609442D
MSATEHSRETDADAAAEVASPPTESQPAKEYRVIADVASDAIVTIDERSRIHYANPAVEDVFGYAPEEIVGEPLTTLMPDEMVEPHLEGIDRYLETGERALDWSYLELPGERKDGTEIPLSVSFGEFERDGRTFFSGIMRDVSEREALEEDLREERNLNRRILETSPTGIMIADRDGDITFANDHARRIVGTDPESIENVSASVAELDAVGADGEALPEDELPFTRVLETGEPVYETEIGLRKPDGERVWVLMNAAPMFDADGEIVDVVFAFQDITERRQLAGELREVYGRVTDAFYALDEQWRITHANDRAEELIDYRDEGLVGERIWDVLEWAEDSRIGEEYREAMATQEPTSFEIYYPEPLDAWYEINAYPSETGLSVYFRDVTERKERERELELFRTLLDNATDSILVIDPSTGEFLDANETACRQLGYDRDELIGLPVHEIDRLFDDSDDWRSHVEDVKAEGGVTIEGVHERKDGTTYLAEVNVTHVELDREYMVAVARDVTERKERERELEESRQRFRTLIEHFPNGAVALVNQDLQYVTFGGTPEGGVDVTRADLEGEPLRDALPPEIAEVVVPRYEAALEGEPSQFESAINDRHYQFHFVPVRDDDGAVFAAMGMSQEVTEQRRRERELQEERDLNRHIVDTSPVGIVRLDAEGIVRNANERAEEILDQPTEAVDEIDDRIDRLDPVLPNGEPIPTDELPTRRVAVEGEEIRDVEIGVLNPDGDRIWLSMSGTPLRDDGEVAGAVVTFADVTDRRLREAALEEYAQQQRTLSQLRRQALEGEDLDELFEATVERVAAVLDHEYAKVLEIEEGGDELFLRSGVGWHEGIVGSATVDTRENSQAGYTLQQSEPVVVEDLDAETRFTGPELLTDHDVAGGISVIVGPRDNPWGVLGTHTTEDREYDDYEVEFVQHVADLLATAIERERHDNQIAALSDVTRVLMEVESPEAVCDIVADAADGDLELPIASIALYDEAAGRLRLAAATPLGERLHEETELFDVSSGLAWDAFVNDERRVDAPDQRIELSTEPVHLRERIALPLGKHGVLLVGVAGEGTMPDPQLDFVETVAATVRAALDRADREETLRDREAALQRQNEDLERLARLNEVVRGIEQVLVGASTRSEIESAVCEQLATVEPYELAWIGRPDTASGGLSRVAGAGETAYLDDVDLTASADDDPEPSLA